MRKVKWLFYLYLTVVGVVTLSLAVAVVVTPPKRDAETMYACFYDPIKSLDPALCYDLTGWMILSNAYECLYTYAYDVRPYELIPQLAAAMPEVSDDHTTYTIRLHKGVRFHDPGRRAFPGGVGPEMTADDVVYSYKRVANFHTHSPLYSPMLQDKLVGLDEWYEYTEKTPKEQVDWQREVEGLKAIDAHTLRVKLLRPNPQFKFQMAALLITCKQAADAYGDDLSHNVVGTGPYALVENRTEERLVFEASPTYRGRPDVDGGATLAAEERLPKIRRLQYDFFQDKLPAWHLFEQRLYDLTLIPKDSFSRAIDENGDLRPEMARRGMVLRKVAEASLYFYGLNMDDPVLGKNKPLRQAMSMAHDRAKFVRIYRNGRGLPATCPLPPGFRTSDADLENPYAKFNLAAAREKMKEAVQIHGGPIPTMSLLTGNDADSRQFADFFIAEMRQIGVELKVEATTYARSQEKVDNRQTQVFVNGWIADYPDEQTFMQMFYSENAPALGVNATAYRNPAFDELYRKAIVMEPSPERDELYRRMIRIVDEDCTWILDYASVRFTIQYDWLSPYKFMDFGGDYRHVMTLDVAKRQAAMR